MAQANVEVLRQAVRGIDQADEALLARLLARAFRIENIVTAVTDKTYHGVTGCLEWRNDMSQAFAPGARYEMETVIAARDDFVVARMAFVGSGARSGAPLHLRWITATWFENGKVARSAGYATRHEALKAVGLEE